VTQEPTHEGARVGLMRLYALSGRRREALGHYERLRETLSKEFGTEPEAATTRLQQEIWAGTFPPDDSPPVAGFPPEDEAPTSPAGAARMHNLPLARTSFIGREREGLEVKRLLAMTRLLTLTGAGGSGKTRLTLKVARDLVGAYPEGVWLVDLAPLTEAELLPQAVAQAVGVREQPGRALLETLKGTLRSRKILLVVDNCEHLVEAVVGLVDALLDCCPHLRILATSRVTLNAAGEVNWVVPSLTVPSLSVTDSRQEAYTPQELEAYESVRLFVARARQRVPSFVLTLWNRQAVAQICRQLDGIPLAIELAAARIGALSAQELAERLDDSLKLLTGGSRTADPRQRSLRATLEWSFELLSEPEQVLFRRLSVFAGGWTLEAAEVVCSGEGIEEGEVLDLLSKLVEKSLVVTEAGQEEDASRFRMLEPVRQYAHEKVEEIGESEAVRRQHAEYFLALAEEADPQLKGAEQEEWLKRLEQEHDNLRAALSWALEQGKAELGLRLSGALGDFWYMHGHLSEGQRWLEAGLAQSGTYSDSARAKALLHAGHIASMLGDYESSVALSEESLALSRKCGDKASSATALYVLSLAALFRNELERASTLAKDAVALKREINDRVGMVRSLLIPGLVAVLRHDYEGAMALHEESLDLAREVEDGFAIVVSLLPGALAFLGQGDHRQTRALCDEGLKLCRHLGVLHGTASLLHIGASLAGAERQPVRSARLWGAAETLYNEMGGTLSPAECQLYGPYIYAARALLDEVAWEAALAEGRAMSTGEAVEYALSEEDEEHESSKLVRAPEQQPLPPDQRAERLTHREQEIALCVARGLTNRQIALELSISEHTVASHVRKILKKLGLRSRAQISTSS
jgi:predicted ATPase/DNA-binding CsgD family transcriptional regulator